MRKLDLVKRLWADETPQILWAYLTIVKIITKETSYSLAFGMETMVPLEIGVSLTSKIRYDKVQNNKAMNVSLDLLKTKWDDSQAYQKGWKNTSTQRFARRLRPKESICHKQRNEFELTWLEIGWTIYRNRSYGG